MFTSRAIFFKPIAEFKSIKITWKLVSKTFKEEGFLTLNVEPDIISKKIKAGDDSSLLLDENKRISIEDYFETIDDND